MPHFGASVFWRLLQSLRLPGFRRGEFESLSPSTMTVFYIVFLFFLCTVLTSFRLCFIVKWFRHAYFEYHSHVRLRLNKLSAGLGEPWTRDVGGFPQGCLLSMMFIVALYLSLCRYLSAQEGVEPQLYAG